VDAVERDLRYVLTVVPASPSVVPDALEDALALCAEVRRLRTLVAEAYREGWSGGECWNDSHYTASDETLAAAWNASESRAALAPTGTPAGGDTDA
jgi:hypothetical protein